MGVDRAGRATATSRRLRKDIPSASSSMQALGCGREETAAGRRWRPSHRDDAAGHARRTLGSSSNDSAFLGSPASWHKASRRY
eukprot:6809827-Prymnesium_polylepis.1